MSSKSITNDLPPARQPDNTLEEAFNSSNDPSKEKSAISNVGTMSDFNEPNTKCSQKVVANRGLIKNPEGGESIKTAFEYEKHNPIECCVPESEVVNSSRPNFVKKLESFVASMEVKNDFKVNLKNNRNHNKSFESSPCPMSQKTSSNKEPSDYFRPLDLTTRKIEAEISYISSDKIKNNSAINELEKKFGQKSKLFEYIGLNSNSITPNCWVKNFKRNLLSSGHPNVNFFDTYLKRNLNYSPKKSDLSPSLHPLKPFRKNSRYNIQQHPASISPNQSKDLVTSSSTLTEECSSTLEQSPEKDSKSSTENKHFSSLSCYTCHQRFKSYLDLTLHMIQANHYDNLVHSLNNNDNDVRPTSSSSNSSAEEAFSNFNSPPSRSSVKSENDKVIQPDKNSETSKIENVEEENEKDDDDDDEEILKRKKSKRGFEYDYDDAALNKEQVRKTNKAAFVGNPADTDLIRNMLSNHDPHNANQYMAWQHLLWTFLKDKECQSPLPPPFVLLPWINAHLYSSMLNLIQQNQKLLKCLPIQQPILPTNPYQHLISRTCPEANHSVKEVYPPWNSKGSFQFSQNLKHKSVRSTVDHSALRQLEGMVYGEKRKFVKTQAQSRVIPRSQKGLADDWVDGGVLRGIQQPPPTSMPPTSNPSTEQHTSVIDKFYKYQQLANDLSSKTK